MVLPWLRDSSGGNASMDSNTPQSIPLSPVEMMERNLLLAKVATQSIWTVDLVMLLENLLQENAINSNSNSQQPNRNNTTYLFCSEVLGVNTDHRTTGYYEKAFSADSARVKKICEDMSRLKLPVLCPFHLEFAQMIDLISNDHCIAILLVDNHVLTQTTENASDSTTQPKDTYIGHYVIVCGISRDPGHIVEAYSAENLAMEEPTNPYCVAVANPGVSNAVMFVNPQKLKQAWRATGTDCDVVFVAKH